jgi:hypothetical protein
VRGRFPLQHRRASTSEMIFGAQETQNIVTLEFFGL